MINAILVDDELKAGKLLHTLIEKIAKNTIHVMDICTSVDAAYHSIITNNPDVIFLDIEIGTTTGFDLLERFEEPGFKCIFVTAYEKYALKAIKFCALDFVLKPIDTEELAIAIAKATKQLKTNNSETTNIKNLLEILQKPKNKNNKMIVPTVSGYKFLPIADVIYLESINGCTNIHCNNNKVVCSTTPLGEYEEMLEDYLFFRVHHSYIINKEFVTEYIKGDGGDVVLNNTVHIPVSRRRKTEFLEWFQ